jgi:hypothetical protein
MARRHGGNRDDSGRPPGDLKQLWEIYRAIEDWRDRKQARWSVSNACRLIAKAGGIKWVDSAGRLVGKPLTDWRRIRNKYYEARAAILVEECMLPSGEKITMTWTSGQKHTPGAMRRAADAAEPELRSIPRDSIKYTSQQTQKVARKIKAKELHGKSS